MKKYLCVTGYVLSEDGDLHRVSAQRLPSLYKVPPGECVFTDDEHEPRLRGHKLKILRPRASGRYDLKQN